LPCLIDHPSNKKLTMLKNNNNKEENLKPNQQKNWYKRIYNELHRYPKIECIIIIFVFIYLLINEI
jgi:hypothetical protein